MAYATISDLRSAGVTTEQANDDRLTYLLNAATEYIDRVTGQWFEPRTSTLVFDGGHTTLWPPAPIISITSITVNDTALNVSTDVITRGTIATDPTEVPRIWLRSTGPTWIASAGRGKERRWPNGRQNIRVTGSFGYVRSDLSTPFEIREVAQRLVLRNLPALTDAAGQADRNRARIVRETTDGHSYELGGAQASSAGSWRFGGATGDPDIDVPLAAYRRPPRAALGR